MECISNGYSILAAPLLLALGLPFWDGLFLYFYVISKWFLFWKEPKILSRCRHKLELSIDYEERRKQTILRFFALFTNVKESPLAWNVEPIFDSLTNILPKGNQPPGRIWFWALYFAKWWFSWFWTMWLLFLSLLGNWVGSVNLDCGCFVDTVELSLPFQLTFVLQCLWLSIIWHLLFPF